uniref:Uncharacterized protein n=1 Tax=Globodera rostochiensis TaxID=31243 RepID=A0A914HCI0_GLORO
MGSSSSSSSSGADWKPVTPCGCGCEHYRAVKEEWQTHPMSAKNKILINTAKTLFALSGGIFILLAAPDTVHHAVLVYFVCGKCGNENRRTYDFFDTGKERGWGYYRRYYKIVATNELDVSYEGVEDVYRRMWTKYKLLDANCEDWARDFNYCVNDKSKEEAAAKRALYRVCPQAIGGSLSSSVHFLNAAMPCPRGGPMPASGRPLVRRGRRTFGCGSVQSRRGLP